MMTARAHFNERWTALAVFVLLTVVFTYPLSIRPGRVLLDDQPDFHLFVWTLGWTAHSLATNPLEVLNANIFHPLKLTFAFSENLIGSGLGTAPLIWLTGNPVLAVNAVSLTSVFLCGLGAFVLARRLGLGVAAAYVCGVIFAFSPPRFFRLGQLHLTAVQWMPFALAYLHTYLDQERRRDLRIAVAFFTLQALSSGHGAVFLALSMAALLAYRAVVDRRIEFGRWIRDLGWPGALLLAPSVLVAIPYWLVQQDIGRGRILEDWTVPAVSYIASPSTVHQRLLSFLGVAAEVNANALAYLFPGYVPLLLAAAAIILAITRRGPFAARTWFYAVLALTSLLITVGPPLGLWPLVYRLPGFNFIRVPSRFFILTVLALAVLSGLAFEQLTRKVRPAAKAALAVGLCVLLLTEFSSIPLHVVPFSARPPAADRWLADRARPFVVAEIPVTGAMRDHSTYMLHSMAHWQPTVHGFSGFDPPEHMRLYATMRQFPGSDSLASMRSFGVTHVVVHIDRFDPQRWEQVSAQLETTTGLELVFQETKSRVYRLR